MSSLVSIRPPRGPIPKNPKTNLRGLTFEALGAFLSRRLRSPKYRVEQVFAWVHVKGATRFASMTDIPQRDREILESCASLESLSLDIVQRSNEDGTRKLRLLTSDGLSLESVLIPNDERGLTQCISSQIGCALTCQFCATAKLGFERNLHAWEIVDQVRQARRLLADEAQLDGGTWAPRITNLVYMGMGEPLHNFNHVRDSLSILTDPHGTPLAKRRITLSSAGLVPAIQRFVDDGLADDFGLAISLNATIDAVRETIMPINRRWNIDALLEVLRSVPTKNRPLTFEYVLLAGINDSDSDAKRLIRLIHGLRCHINLIPFNENPHSDFRAPTRERIEGFTAILRRSRTPCYLRQPRGRDIDAACGQLALKKT